ncbi:unnamed protein product [Staurois parvus]|uniref:Uncharacterized protein n=1 Tax=Staurois parvus TaxID=386267 RepID=A0ABN9EKJ8_9NEOB|nr:unnamed protein product [Staurois parvus]
MIPKPNTDMTTWCNYRLISLPGADWQLMGPPGNRGIMGPLCPRPHSNHTQKSL